jgi:hypothetical protein
MRSMGDPNYVYRPWSEERRAAASRRVFMKIIRDEAEIIAETNEGSIFEAAVLLLVIIKKKGADRAMLRDLTGFSYHTILVMIVRAKLAAILFDDGTFNQGVLADCEDAASARVIEILLTGCMAGTFIRTIDDKWRTGDQSDPDGANWPQHLAHGLAICFGKHYVFNRAEEASAA